MAYENHRRKQCTNCGYGLFFTDKTKCYFTVFGLFGNEPDHKPLDPDGRTCGGDLVEPDDGMCTKAAIGHGPGHQSTTHCDVKGPHDLHHCVYGSYNETAYWRGSGLKCSGYFDEPPYED